MIKHAIKNSFNNNLQDLINVIIIKPAGIIKYKKYFRLFISFEVVVAE